LSIKFVLTLYVPDVEYISHENTFRHCPKAKRPVSEIKKVISARSHNFTFTLDLAISWHLKG